MQQLHNKCIKNTKQNQANPTSNKQTNIPMLCNPANFANRNSVKPTNNVLINVPTTANNAIDNTFRNRPFFFNEYPLSKMMAGRMTKSKSAVLNVNT